jgi:predicted ester cyclase
MTKTIARLACLALLVGGAGCKKDKKGGKADSPETADKTTEKVETPPPVEKPKLDTIEDRVAFYRACYGHLNAKDWDKFGACYTDGVVSENAGVATFNGRDAVLENIKNLTTALPDLDVTPTFVIASGNYVGAISTVTGTNSGAMKMGDHEMPATGKKVGFEQWHMVEIDPAAGGAVKEWLVADHSTIMGQLGMNPNPTRPVATKPTGEPTVVIAKGDDAEKANLAAYTAISVDAFNKHDQKALMAGYAPTAKIMDRTMPADTDVKGAEKMFKEFIKGFPDIKTEMVASFAAGDYVVGAQKATGTNKGDLPSMGIKKTGKPVDMTVVEVVKLDKGKAVEHHIFMNAMAMAQQLGLIPPMGGGEDMKGEGKAEDMKAGEKTPAEKAGDKKPDETQAEEKEETP